MSIAFVSAADGGTNGGSGALTFSFTVGAGSNGFLIIPVAGDSVGGADDVTATYNGTSAPLLAKYTTGTGGDRMLYFFGQYAPSSGAHNVVVTPVAAHAVYAGGYFLTGVKQSGQPDNSTTNIEVSSALKTLTTLLTPVADNSWTVLLEGCYDGGPGASQPGAGTGSTRRAADGLDGAWGIFDSNGLIHPAAPYSMTTTRVNDPFGLLIQHLMISISPDTGGVTVTYPQLERGTRGLNRGICLGAY